jgi:hypothetical protein
MTTTLSSVLKSSRRIINAQTNTEVSGTPVVDRIPVPALMHAVQTLLEESAETIVGLLGDEHQWAPDLRAEVVRRIRDLQFARLSTIVTARTAVPIVRTPATMDAYFLSLDAAYNQAQDQLYLRARHHR